MTPPPAAPRFRGLCVHPPLRAGRAATLLRDMVLELWRHRLVPRAEADEALRFLDSL